MDALERFIAAKVKESAMPGLACAAVVGENVVWSKGFGWADVERCVPMTADTMMNIASVSKTVTATAILHLWERKGFDLDADASDILGFLVRNPRHPQVPITIRQLLAHRSSIQDGPAYDRSYVCGESSVSLEEWLLGFLLPDGGMFDVERNFHPWAPGTPDPPADPRPYSNVGYGLLALVLEAIAGTSFEAYCKAALFDPLGMTSSTWLLSEVPEGRHAALYSTIPESEENFDEEAYVPEQRQSARSAPAGSLFRHCLYSFPIRSDGLLRTTANDLGRFLSLYTNRGYFAGQRILRAETLEMMLSDRHFGRALCWQGGSRPDGRILWQHGGGDPGVRTVVTYQPKLELGILMLSNYGSPEPSLPRIHQEIQQESVTGNR